MKLIRFLSGLSCAVTIFSGREPNSTTIAYKPSEASTKSLEMISNPQETWEGEATRLQNKSNHDHGISKNNVKQDVETRCKSGMQSNMGGTNDIFTSSY